MKQIYLLIGIMLALVVCITPVAAVSADDFEINEKVVDGVDMYTYRNVSNPDEKYTEIWTTGTHWLNSYVTFKPANIPDAPVMKVHTVMVPVFHNPKKIYLPRSVDEWEIKYYSHWKHMPHLDDEFLKNAGVVNLNEYFGKYITSGLNMELSTCQFIYPSYRVDLKYSIPDV